MKTERTVQLRNVCLRGELAPGGEDRRAALTFYSGQPVERSDPFDDPFELTFELTAGAVKLDRLNAGAPLTVNHSRAVADQVGVVEKAWLEGGAARASVRFSTREDVQALWRDVQEGVVRNVSMEAAIHEMEETTPKKAKRRSYRATKWEPVALSIVTVPADAGAGFFASDQQTHECVIHGVTMTDELDTQTDDEREVAKLEAKAARAEAKRRARIEQLADEDRGFGCGDLWAQKMIASDHDDNELCRLASADRVKRDRAQYPGTHSGCSIESDHDAPGVKLAAMAEGLAARATGAEPSGPGRRWACSSFVELAYETLGWRGMHHGLDVRHHAGRIAQLALTTSDYPLLLANTGNKVLASAYEAAAPVFRLLARREDLKDFKRNSYLKVGDFPTPVEVSEGGEVTYGAFSEDGETWALATYGRIVHFSRQSLVNDDLAAFARMMGGAGERIAQFENGLFFALLTSGTSNNGPTMADAAQLFATGHANLAGSGTAISVDTLGAGRAAMQKQTSLDAIKLNILPRYLVVSPDKRTIAEQYTTVIAPALGSSVNPFQGRLEVVSDANLTGNAWYLWADPSRAAAAVYGHLAGETGPRIEVRLGFEREGLEMKAAVDFACAFVEHRAAWRNPGA